MNDEGKFPFDGTPKVGDDFQESRNKTQEVIDEEKAEKENIESEKEYDKPEPAPKPSWASPSYEFTRNEEQLPYILPENFRSSEISQKNQNYDVIKDNNIETEFDLKNQWDTKVWEAPSPEIGDD